MSDFILPTWNIKTNRKKKQKTNRKNVLILEDDDKNVSEFLCKEIKLKIMISTSDYLYKMMKPSEVFISL